MAQYIDGFLIPLPKKNLARYKRLASKASKVWMDHGALQYMECIGEDLSVEGLFYSFTKAAKCKPGETVVFSYIVYKSRKHRDQVNAKVMSDPRIAAMMKEQEKRPPFDHKRMAYGGFESIVQKSR